MEDLNLDFYLSQYDTFNKIIVFSFSRGQGGIGDLLKFFMYTLIVCIKNKFKFYFLIEPPEIYPIHKYITLKDKYKHMILLKLSESAITNSKNIDIFDEYSINFKDFQEGIFYKISPDSMYHVSDLFDKITIKASELFEFSQDIKLNSQIYNKLDYISIHLRLGDKYLETNPRFVMIKDDTRIYNEENLYKFISEANKKSKNIIFFCDNKSYKLKLKEKYNFIIVTDYEIGHTGLSNTTEKQILDSVTEFYILSNSTKIYKASHSGFSIMASKFNNLENHIYSLES
jgi:hypothetical protein